MLATMHASPLTENKPGSKETSAFEFLIYLSILLLFFTCYIALIKHKSLIPERLLRFLQI